MTATTCIRNIAWLIAWDAREGRHTYRRDVDLAFEGFDEIENGRGGNTLFLRRAAREGLGHSFRGAEGA